MSSDGAKTKGIDHVGLTVSSLTQSLDFFVNALGFTEIGGKPDYPAAYISDGTATLTLWQTSDPGDYTEFDRRRNIGLHHLALAVASRRADHERIDQASKEARQAAHDMKAATTQVRTAADQRRRLWQGIGSGALASILLWSFLPGAIARSMPESWHWPERMAARMVGESSRWDAGTRLMRSESPQALNALERAAELLRDNREDIEACQKSASNSKQSVRCTVRIRPESETRN